MMLCVVGVAAPYAMFLPWLREHGFSAALFVQQMFANRISSFFVSDVLVSAIVLMVFTRQESARLSIKRSLWPLLALLTVGVSLALPLFLYLRERRLEELDAKR
jgi:hypothetical protein